MTEEYNIFNKPTSYNLKLDSELLKKDEENLRNELNEIERQINELVNANPIIFQYRVLKNKEKEIKDKLKIYDPITIMF